MEIMNLSNAELTKIYESMKLMKEDENIKDPAFISAFEKLDTLRKENAEQYNVYME